MTPDETIAAGIAEFRKLLQKANAERELFRQLTSEALALLDETDPDHESMDLKSWLRNAQQALGRHTDTLPESALPKTLSAQPCGCDPGANWTCELHRKVAPWIEKVD